MLKTLVPGAMTAMLWSMAILTPATATVAPATSMVAQLEAAKPANILQVRDRHDRRDHDRWDDDRRDRHRYHPGRRYREAPRHWHRYHRRPHDWYTRGCIVVGPVWFCP